MSKDAGTYIAVSLRPHIGELLEGLHKAATKYPVVAVHLIVYLETLLNRIMDGDEAALRVEATGMVADLLGLTYQDLRCAPVSFLALLLQMSKTTPYNKLRQEIYGMQTKYRHYMEKLIYGDKDQDQDKDLFGAIENADPPPSLDPPPGQE